MFEWESHGRIFENSHQKCEANTQYADADDEIDVVYICSMQKVKVKLEEGCGDFKTFQMLKWRGKFHHAALWKHELCVRNFKLFEMHYKIYEFISISYRGGRKLSIEMI